MFCRGNAIECHYFSKRSRTTFRNRSQLFHDIRLTAVVCKTINKCFTWWEMSFWEAEAQEMFGLGFWWSLPRLQGSCTTARQPCLLRGPGLVALDNRDEVYKIHRFSVWFRDSCHQRRVYLKDPFLTLPCVLDITKVGLHCTSELWRNIECFNFKLASSEGIARNKDVILLAHVGVSICWQVEKDAEGSH